MVTTSLSKNQNQNLNQEETTIEIMTAIGLTIDTTIDAMTVEETEIETTEDLTLRNGNSRNYNDQKAIVLRQWLFC